MKFKCRLACVLGIVTGSISAVTAQPDANPRPCTQAHLTESAVVQGYTFKAYEGGNSDIPGCMRVYRQGKLIYLLANDVGMQYHLGQPSDHVNKIPFVPNGSNLIGNGRPDMIVTSWSGGAHCCFSHYIFELEPKLRLMTTLNDGDTDLGHFEDLDHNGRYFYVTDEIWSYWPASFAGSVSHKVILKWDEDRFRLDLERMKYRAPTPVQWNAELKDVDDVADDRASLGVTLWDTVLDLIYTGHSELAWKFVKEVNPNALKGNNPSLEDFCSMLKDSEFWPDVKPTLKDVPDECAQAKGKAQK